MGALDGFRVLDLSQVVQGPQAGAMLADMGADVIKVELPRIGDLSRSIPMAPDDRRSAYFFACNRGKRSLTL
ncbi:MAG TPA: CoA transferase, partial [Dehalococcoidia bacterium]|nr:CoA transferase [Dehalococcoidia bacterium]